jgi:hypothetical protein
MQQGRTKEEMYLKCLEKGHLKDKRVHRKVLNGI